MTDPATAAFTDPERLAAEMAWLRRIAAALLGREVDADDLVQDASLAALEHLPADLAARRGWLAKVLRHRAAAVHRRAVRLQAREAAVARPEASTAHDPAELSARVEMHRLLAAEVIALAPPLREAVILRYFEALPPREIARRLAVPVETVKSRLARGLRQLRGRLEQRCGGAAALRGALVPLAGFHGLRVPVLGSALAAVLVTDILMKKLLFAAVLLLAGIAWWSFAATPGAGPDAAPPPGGAPPPPAAAAANPHGTPAADRPEAAAPPERSPLAAPAGVGAAPLRIQVVDAAGQPVAGVPVRAHIETAQPGEHRGSAGVVAGVQAGAHIETDSSHTKHSGWGRAHDLGTTAGELGMLVVTEPLPWEEGETTATVFADVYVRQPPRCTVQREAMPVDVLQLVLPPTGEVVVEFRHSSGLALELGRYVGIDVAAPEGGRVWPDPSAMPGNRLAPRLDVDAHALGRSIRFEHVELGLSLQVQAQEKALDLHWRLTHIGQVIAGPTEAGETVTCTFVSEHPLLCGRLRMPDGSPVASSLVEFSLLRSTAGANRSSVGTLRTDAEGGFVVPAGWHLRPETSGNGTVEVRRDLFFSLRDPRTSPDRPPQAAIAEGSLAGQVTLPEIDPLGTHELGDVQLAPLGIVVAGQVVDGEGKAVEGVLLFVQGPPWLPGAGTSAAGHPAGLIGTQRTDAEGRFSIPGLALADRVRIMATKDRWPVATLDVVAGGSEPVVLRMRRGARLYGGLIVDPAVPASAATRRPAVSRGESLTVLLRTAGCRSEVPVLRSPAGCLPVGGLPRWGATRGSARSHDRRRRRLSGRAPAGPRPARQDHRRRA